MKQARDSRIEQVRQSIFERADQMTQQVTRAAEEAGRRAAEARIRAAEEEQEEHGTEALWYTRWMF